MSTEETRQKKCYQELISQIDFPHLDDIADYAKTMGITEPRVFLELIDKIQYDRNFRRNSEENWDVP